MKRTLAFYSGLFLFFLVLQKVSGVITKIILAHALTPSDYGLITLVTLSLPALLQVVTNLNFYEILSHSRGGSDYFGFTVVASMIFTAGISILIWIFRASFFTYLNIQGHQDLLLVSLVFTLISGTLIIDFQGLYTGLKRYSLPGVLNAIPSVSKMVLVAILFFSRSTSFEILLLAITFANAIPALYLLLPGDGRHDLGLIRSIRLPSRKIFVFGASLLLIGSFSTIGQGLIKIVISHELGMDWQGYFDVSLTFGSLLLFTIGTMSFISVPEATGTHPDRLRDKGGLGDIVRTLFAATVLISIILYYYSGTLITLVFSESYREAGEFFSLLIPGYLLLFILQFYSTLVISFGEELKDFIRVIIVPIACLPFFFVVPLFLIRTFSHPPDGNGFAAAYLSYSLLILTCTVGTILVSGNYRPLAILTDKIGRLLLASILAFAAIPVIHPGPLLGIPMAILIFGTVTIGTGYVSMEMITEIFHGKE